MPGKIIQAKLNLADKNLFLYIKKGEKIMSTSKQLKLGTMTLKFSKPVPERSSAKSLVGILQTAEDAVNTVRSLRDMDLSRERARLND